MILHIMKVLVKRINFCFPYLDEIFLLERINCVSSAAVIFVVASIVYAAELLLFAFDLFASE